MGKLEKADTTRMPPTSSIFLNYSSIYLISHGIFDYSHASRRMASLFPRLSFSRDCRITVSTAQYFFAAICLGNYCPTADSRLLAYHFPYSRTFRYAVRSSQCCAAARFLSRHLLFSRTFWFTMLPEIKLKRQNGEPAGALRL